MTLICCDGQSLFEMLKLKDKDVQAGDATYKSIFPCIGGLHVMLENLKKTFDLLHGFAFPFI